MRKVLQFLDLALLENFQMGRDGQLPMNGEEGLSRGRNASINMGKEKKMSK